MAERSLKTKTILADTGLLYAAIIWGSTFYVVKDALAGIDPVAMVAYRFLLAGSLLLIFLKITGRPIMAQWRVSFFLAIVLYALYATQTIGLRYTTASNSGFITGLFVLFVPVFMLILFKAKPRRIDWLASFISLAGLWVLTGGLTDINSGDLMTLIAAVTYALHVLLTDKYMKAGLDPFIISCQQFLFVGIFALITSLLFDLPLAITTKAAGWSVVFLALAPTLSAFLIQCVAQKFTTPVKVSLIFALEPVFAALFAWTLGGEILVPHRALGGLLIFFALIISALPAKKVSK